MTEAGWTRKKAEKLCEAWFDTGARASWCPKMVDEFAAALADSYQQGRVAAAKECEKYARACVHERAVTLDGFTGSSAMAGVIRGKQSEAERIAEWCHSLAQQAQEGK